MMDLRRFIEEKWVRNGKICHLWAKLAYWYRYQKWVPVPMDRDQMVPLPVVSGTGTHLQNRVGTGTDQSGTDTNASSSPDFCTFALLSPIFVHRLFRDLNK